MAEVLDAFPEADARGRYPWGEWLDGQPRQLSRGTKEQVENGEADFFVTAKSFRSAVQQASKNRQGRPKTAILKNGDAIAIQFIPNPRAEVTEE